MVDEFWRLYNQIRFAYHYHQIIREQTARKIKRVVIISYIVTTISLTGWAITEKAAVFWSIVIFASQLATGLKDLLGWSEEQLRLSEYLSDMTEIISDLEKSWRQIKLSQLTEKEIMQKMNTIDERYKKLECRYILPCNFTESLSAINDANIKTNVELTSLHGGGDENHERKLEAVESCAYP